MKIFQILNVKNHYVIQSCLAISLVTVTTWVTKILRKKIKIRQNDNAQQCVNNKITSIPLIVITGCDTGLGYSIVMRYLKGEHVNKNQNDSKIYNIFNNKALIIPSRIAIVAFCLNPNSPDLTDTDSIKTGVSFVTDLLQTNVDINYSHNEAVFFKYELHALVNNAARMVMAEYEWQTSKMMKQQFEVNILGPIMLTAMLLPTFRKYKSRVINVISHCAYLPLPGVSIYGATKAAIRAWTIGTRVELDNHGIKMITFSPGSFYLHSSIMNGEQRMIDYEDMCNNMNKEQLAYYGAFMDTYQNYLSKIDAFINPPEIAIPSTNKIYYQMDSALWAVQPKAEYNVPEPWRYRIYFAVAWTLSSLGLHYFKDKVVRKFVATPQFHNNITSSVENVQ